MSVFDRLERLAFEPVRRLVGEAATIRPMTRVGGVNGPVGVDPARPVVMLAAPRAVFDEAIEAANAPNAWDSRALDRLRELGANLTIEFAAEDVGFDVVAGDRVDRPATGDILTVVGLVARSGASVTLGLARAGRL